MPARSVGSHPEDASRIGAAFPSGVWHVHTRYVPACAGAAKPSTDNDNPHHYRHASLLHRARS